MQQNILKSVQLKLESQVIQLEFDLNNLLEKHVGIGEHVRLSEDIEKLFLELLEKKHILAECNSYLNKPEKILDTPKSIYPPIMLYNTDFPLSH